ncbi:MAG: hypothetical protein KAH22_01705, partial [Thiotrichaceae bacterium]|nr:hypothetical protein [Thiotrichaceae bacterium]
MYKKLSLSILISLIISGCNESKVTTAITHDSVPGIAELGRLGGATVKIYELNGAVKTLKWEETTSNHPTDLAKIGIFNSHSRLMNINKAYTIEVTGGTDYDADDNGIIDAIPTNNLGTLRMITKGDWCYTCEGHPIRVTLAGELAYRLLEDKINNGTLEEGDISNIAKEILSKDLDGDGKVDTRDLLLFDPVNNFHAINELLIPNIPKLLNDIHTQTLEEFNNPDTKDSDGDGILDKNEFDGDSDNDGIHNRLDFDDDGDGIATINEVNNGLDRTRDDNGDGIPNYLDSSNVIANKPAKEQDSDNDGILDRDESGDTDGDGTPNHLDADDDGDGIPTVDELVYARNKDTDGDGKPDYLDTDSDNDGIPDNVEALIPSNICDTDGDTKPDYTEIDSDNDGILDSVEVGANPLIPVDTDGDGIPDIIDTDSDNDGIPDRVEAGENPAILVDTDGDGIPDVLDTDSDNDGIPDSIEAGANPTIPLDTDGDGTPNALDTDSDNDGIPDRVEAGATPATSIDSDDDGIPDALDTDSDNDGILDSVEAGENPAIPVDTDGDGTPNNLDPDDDNDGVATQDEQAHGTDPTESSSNRPASKQAAKDAIAGTLARPVTAAELNSLDGIIGADPEKDYTQDLKKGEDPSPMEDDILTPEEASAESESDPKPQYADPNNPTAAEIQEIIDARNAGVISLPSIGGIYNEIVTVYAGDPIELIGNESYDLDDINAGANAVGNFKWIRACRGGVRGWQVVSDGSDADTNDTPPTGSTYCIYRLTVRDKDTNRIDTNRNGFEERRILRVRIEPAVAENERPVALATANGLAPPRWVDIGIGDTVELNAEDSYDGESTQTDGIVLHEWYRALVGILGQKRGWQKIGEGKELVDELPIATRRASARYFVKVSDADSNVDNSLNQFKPKSSLNFIMDPESEINSKPIGIIGFKVGARLRPVKVIRKDGASEEVTLDATRSRDREGVVQYTFSRSTNGTTWTPINECIDSDIGTCVDTPDANQDPAFRRFWSRTFYKVEVKDANNNVDDSVKRIAYVRNTVADTRPPVARLLLNGRGGLIVKNADAEKPITIDASKSTDNDAVVNYKIEKSSTGKDGPWTVLSESDTVTSITDAPGLNAEDIRGIWSRTYYRVTVTDPADLTHTSVVNRRGIAVYVRKVLTPFVRPIGKIQIDKKLLNNPETVILDGATSIAGTVESYTFLKSLTGPRGPYAEIEGCVAITETICADTPNREAQVLGRGVNKKYRTWYKTVVTDIEGLSSSNPRPIVYVDIKEEVAAAVDKIAPTARLEIPTFENGD